MGLLHVAARKKLLLKLIRRQWKQQAPPVGWDESSGSPIPNSATYTNSIYQSFNNTPSEERPHTTHKCMHNADNLMQQLLRMMSYDFRSGHKLVCRRGRNIEEAVNISLKRPKALSETSVSPLSFSSGYITVVINQKLCGAHNTVTERIFMS